MATNVYINDANLVALYRFKTYAADEQLLNSTTSTIYTGLNTMQISGTPTQDADIPSQVEDGSGVKFEGSSDMFHLHMTSGNESGISSQSGSQFTVGFFGRPSVHASTRSWMGQSSSQASGAYWRVESNALGVGVGWRFVYGVTSGTSSLAVASPWQADITHYESVIVTINGTDNRIYVSGVLANSGALQYSPGPSGSSGILIDLVDVPFRIGAHRAFSSQSATNAVGIESGLMAEAFVMNRVLTEDEIVGIASSGIRTPAIGNQNDSDNLDSSKDTLGSITGSSVPVISITAWDGNAQADPSGMRQISGAFHPSFLKLLGPSASSGLSFTGTFRGTPSDPVAITFRNATSGTNISNLKIWLDNYDAFASTQGYEVSVHINGKWLPGLVLPSGSGVVGKTFQTASSIYRSDGYNGLSGIPTQGTASSGEGDISQYVYLAFDSNNDLDLGTYGTTGFSFKVTADYV